jgi:hypothetical protein
MWRNEWESLGGRDDLAKTLEKNVAKDATKWKRAVALEVLAAIFSSSVSMFFAIASHGAPTAVAMCAGIYLFNGVWLTRLFTIRGDDKAAGTGLDAFVELTRKRLDADLRWNAFARRSCQVLGVVATAWSIWMLIEGWKFYLAEPWRGVIGFGGIYVILAGLFYALGRKRKKIAETREHFETLLAERTLA